MLVKEELLNALYKTLALSTIECTKDVIEYVNENSGQSVPMVIVNDVARLKNVDKVHKT